MAGIEEYHSIWAKRRCQPNRYYGVCMAQDIVLPRFLDNDVDPLADIIPHDGSFRSVL